MQRNSPKIGYICTMAVNPIITAMERRSGVAASNVAIDFSKLMILVVDAVPDMRAAMSMTLASFGANRIEFAGRVSEAIGRIRRTQYDVILADYRLTHDYDGVHLFEEAKKYNLLKQSCVFVVVTSERRSQMVMGAVELAPDDYLIKPFSGQVLAERLEKAIRKKKEFECVDAAIMGHRYLQAIEECNRRIKANDPFLLDFLKLKGRLLITTGDYDAGLQTYSSILNSRDFPWAKLGLAKCKYHLQDIDGAEALFTEVLSVNDRVMEAYDWLARIYAQKNEHARAQEFLQKAISISPWMVKRQKHLGQVAHRNQALAVAEEAYKKTIGIAKNSFWREAGDYASLARVQLDNDNAAAALATVNEVRREFQHEPQAQMLSYAVEAMVHKKSGERDRAMAALLEAQRRHGELGEVPEEYTLNLAQACFENGKTEAANELVRNVVRNNHEDPETINRIKDLYQAVGREDEGEAMVRETAGGIVDVNNNAVRMAREGNYDGAVKLFLKALELMPNNVQILLNTINALLGLINTQGWNEEYMELVTRFVERTRSLDRTSTKFQKLEQLMQDTRRRFNVKQG